MNLEAPEKVSTALQAALKLPIMPFNGFGKMGPAEHKDWYFDFGVGVAEHITIDGKPFEISKSEILNREAKIAYPCKLGAMLELHLLIALRKLDKEGLDASGDHLVEAYRSALDALEKELTLSNVNTTESREPQ